MKDDKINEESFSILLVEDDQGHAELVMHSLKDHQLINKIYHVSDGEAALNYLFQRDAYADPKKSPRPHLVLLDLRLPRIDGLEVLEQIKTSDKLKKLPVIIFSTSDSEQDMSMAYELHANSYLVKPIDFEELIKLMDDLVFYWLGSNRHPWK